MKIGRLFTKAKNKPQQLDEPDAEFIPRNVDESNQSNVVDLFHSKKWQDSIQAWMQILPAHVRPIGLVEQYPRIASRIMLHWNDPRGLEAYFQALLFDQREGRKGFPKSIGTELLRLQNYLLKRARNMQPQHVTTADGVKDIWRHVRSKEVRHSKQFEPLL